MTRLFVRLTPKARTDAIDGWDADAEGRAFLKVRVRAQPIEGEANAALIALLAKTLGRPKSALTIAAGTTGRLKRIEIEGVTEAALTTALGHPG